MTKRVSQWLILASAFIFLFGSISANPTVYYTSANANVVVSSDTTLTSDLVCGSLTIYQQVTLYTNGFNIYCNGTVTNFGVIMTGHRSDALGPALYAGSQGTSFASSFGGSGGGGGSGWAGASGFYSGKGGDTLVAGGAGANSNTTNGGNGSTPNVPLMSNENIITWYNGSFKNYLSGAGGGQSSSTGGSSHPCPKAGSSAYGVYIQANQIKAGIIDAAGVKGEDASQYCLEPWDPGGAGSGGGAIVLAYGLGGYTAGAYNVAGGAAGSPYLQTGTGGAGGNGQVVTYGYGSDAPIVVLSLAPTLSTLAPAIGTGVAIATAIAASVAYSRMRRTRRRRR